jgi:FlaA1/EpsC-like NDP-sugar epimerase
MPQLTTTQRKAVIGDVSVLVLLTVVGFATHLTLDAFGRMFATGITALLAWAAVARFLGVYRPAVISDPRSIWRVAWAWLLAAPLATFLRGVVLARDIPPTFVIVVILVNGSALVAWRIALGWMLARSHRVDARSMSSRG